MALAWRGPKPDPDTRPLIAHQAGVPIASETIGAWVRDLGSAIGRPDLTPHELRRSYATRIRDLGAELETAQRMLGHASPATTAAYYDVGDRTWNAGLSLPLIPGGAA
jgi:integrase